MTTKIMLSGDGDRYLATINTPTGTGIGVYAYGELQGVAAWTADELFMSALPECIHCGSAVLDTGQELVDEHRSGAVCEDGPHPHCIGYAPEADGMCGNCGLHIADHWTENRQRHDGKALAEALVADATSTHRDRPDQEERHG